MHCLEELFTLDSDFAEVKQLVLLRAHAMLQPGERFLLLYDPDRLRVYGRVKAIQCVFGEELEQQERWDMVEHDGPGVYDVLHGAYMLGRGLGTGSESPIPEAWLARRRVRYASVRTIMAATPPPQEDGCSSPKAPFS